MKTLITKRNVTLATLFAGCVAMGAFSPPSEVTAMRSVLYWTTLATDAPRTLFYTWPHVAQTATLRFMHGSKLLSSQTIVREGGEKYLDVAMPEIPDPASVAAECVYTFELEFDTGVKRTAQVASVRGVRNLGTRVIASATGTCESAWQSVLRRAVIPIIDEGVETVSLNGEPVLSGLNGQCGWYEWDRMPPGLNTFEAGGRTALLRGRDPGFSILIR